jgi:hypothetical protein
LTPSCHSDWSKALRFENLPDLSTSFFQLSAGAH